MIEKWHFVRSSKFEEASMMILALRSPPFLPDSLASFLFETHWAYWLIAVALGVILIYVAATRNDPRLRLSGIILVVATALWGILAALVVTPDERLHNAHTALADACRQNDVPRILSYLSPDFTATPLDIRLDPTLSAAKAQIADDLKKYGVKETIIRQYQSVRRGPTAAVNVTLLTQTDMGPILSSWVLSWDDIPENDWKIVNARLTKLGDQAVPNDMVIR
jgi:hypothetical protein